MRTVISKEDAARRQLDAAIELFFSEGDLLAIYALASAVFMITENLQEKKNQASGKTSPDATFFSILKARWTAIEFKELKDALGKISGFLKHANHSNDNEMKDLNEIQTLAFLALTASNFKSVFGYLTVPMQQISGHALMAADDDKLLTSGLDQTAIDNIRKFRGKDPRFLKQAALDGIYRAKGVDPRKTNIGHIILNP